MARNRLELTKMPAKDRAKQRGRKMYRGQIYCFRGTYDEAAPRSTPDRIGGQTEAANEECSDQEVNRLDDAREEAPEVDETRRFYSGSRRAPTPQLLDRKRVRNY